MIDIATENDNAGQVSNEIVENALSKIKGLIDKNEEPQPPFKAAYPVSACIIWCEEDAAFINRCLASLPPGIEICLVQTLPTPRETYAETFPAELNNGNLVKRGKYYYHADNTDDILGLNLAVARNVAKSLATQEFILSIDADEVLIFDEYEWHTQLFNSPKSIGAFMVKLGSAMYADHLWHLNMGDKIRIFRNHNLFRWERPIHEQILPSIQRNGFLWQDTNIWIKHYGYHDKARHIVHLKRNISIMIHHLNIYPEDKFILKTLWENLTALESLEGIHHENISQYLKEQLNGNTN